jgi:hypothetical protein
LISQSRGLGDVYKRQGRFYTDGSLTQTMDRALQVADYLLGEVRRGR